MANQYIINHMTEQDAKIKEIEKQFHSLISSIQQNSFTQDIINGQLKEVTEYIKKNFVLRTIPITLPEHPTSNTTYNLPYKNWYDSGIYVVESSYNTIILPNNCKNNYFIQIFNYRNISINVQTSSGLIFSKIYAPVTGINNIVLEPNRSIILYYNHNNRTNQPQWTANMM